MVSIWFDLRAYGSVSLPVHTQAGRMQAWWEYPTERVTLQQHISKERVTMDVAKVDAKGRLSIPLDIRNRAGIQPGDVYFVAFEGSEIRLAKAINPFDALADQAISKYKAGETMSLRDFAEEEGFDLDAE